MTEDIFDKNLTMNRATPVHNATKIRVVFSNGEYALVDLENDISERQRIAMLRNPDFFSKCAIIDDGMTLAWPGDITIGWDTLYHLAREQNTLMSGNDMDSEEFRKWLKIACRNQEEAAQLLGYSQRQIGKFATGKADVPAAVRLACMAIQAGLHLR